MKACYPGSFDPLSNGHLDIIKRASKLFDEVHVLIPINISKKSLFTVEERIDLIKECTKDIPNIIITPCSTLTVKYCEDNDIKIIIRGARNYQDFENEYTLHHFNHNIYSDIETILFFSSIDNQIISSSKIKELLYFNCDISKYVPEQIKDKIINKMKQ